MNDAVQWRVVPGTSDYEISEDGQMRRGSRPIRPVPATNGYLKYGLYINGRRQTVSAHRLVAITFLGPPPFEGAWVLHADDCRTNNHVSNLRWGAPKDNVGDARRNGRIETGTAHSSHRRPWDRPRGETHSSAKLSDREVIEIMRAPGKQRDIAARYGVNQALVWRIKNGLVWKHLTNPAYAAKLANRGDDEEGIRIINQFRGKP